MKALSKTSIDYLAFRHQGGVKEGAEALATLFGTIGQEFNLHPLSRGMLGFQQACELRLVDLVIGRMDYGGDSQRGWVRVVLTGKGCEWVESWQRAIDVLGALERSEIRRLDIALTTWRGEVTHERIVAAHTARGFCAGGRPPDLQQITNSNPRAGRTAYVGRRESDKFLRCYEKGFEMLGRRGPAGESINEIGGHAVEGIYRCEVELKAKQRPIPWDVIERRDAVFAGCYPFLAELLPEVEPDWLMQCKEVAPRMDLDSMLATMKHQFGPALFTALVALDGDIFAVWDRIVGHVHSERLLAAGVLLVDHVPELALSDGEGG